MRITSIKLLIFLIIWACQPSTCGDSLSFDDDYPPIRSATFFGRRFAWIIRDDGGMNKSDDEGNTWQTFSKEVVDGFRPLSFTHNTQGWMIGRHGQVYRTGDGGKSWEVISEIAPHRKLGFFIRSIDFTNSLNGFAIEMPGFLWRSNNGGKHWSELPLFSPSQDFKSLTSISTFGTSQIWIGGVRGLLLYSSDGGSTWQDRSLSVEAHFEDLHFLDKNYGWAIIGSQLFSSANGGSTWAYNPVLLSRTRNIQLLSVYFANKRLGVVVGGEYKKKSTSYKVSEMRGVIFLTRNAGQSWQEINLDSDFSLLTKVYFSDSKNGWMISRNTVYRTTNGGLNWKSRLVVGKN